MNLIVSVIVDEFDAHLYSLVPLLLEFLQQFTRGGYYNAVAVKCYFKQSYVINLFGFLDEWQVVVYSCCGFL